MFDFNTTTASPNLTTMLPGLATTRPFINEGSNGTSNTTTTPPHSTCFSTITLTDQVMLTIVNVLVFVISITGNSVIIYIICCYRNIKNPFNILIVNMATADILDTVIAIPPQVNFLFSDSTYPNDIIGEILCRVYPYFLDVAISASVLTLTVIAIDRYLAIVHVLRTPMSIRAVRRAILGIWLSSAVLFSYNLYRFRLFPIHNTKRAWCSVLWTNLNENEYLELERSLHVADFLLKLILHYILPLCVMVVFYSIILLHMWQRKAPGELADQHQRRLETQKHKIIKMLVTIVTVFAVCWVPVHVYHAILTFHHSWLNCKVSVVVLLVFIFLAHANAAINPCLYLIFNQSFRDGLKHLLNKILRKEVTLVERTSTTRDVISGATAIPNIGYHPSTPQLTRLNTSSSCDEVADSRL